MLIANINFAKINRQPARDTSILVNLDADVFCIQDTENAAELIRVSLPPHLHVAYEGHGVMLVSRVELSDIEAHAINEDFSVITLYTGGSRRLFVFNYSPGQNLKADQKQLSAVLESSSLSNAIICGSAPGLHNNFKFNRYDIFKTLQRSGLNVIGTINNFTAWSKNIELSENVVIPENILGGKNSWAVYEA